MKATNVSFVFVVAVVLPLLLASSLGSRATQMNIFVTNAGGFYSSADDLTVQSPGSGDDLAVDNTLDSGFSSELQWSKCGDDYLSLTGYDLPQRELPAFSVGLNRGELLLDFRTLCIMKVEPVRLSVGVLGTVLSGHVASGIWTSLVAVFGVVANKQPKRLPTPAPTFKKSKPRLTTDTVSFRIDSSLRENLEEEAKKNRTSLNTLVSQILFRYADWGRYAGRLGLIPVSKDLLRDVFKVLDKPELEDLGRKFAETSGREHVLYLFQQISFGTVLQFLDLWSSHFDAYEHRYDGKMHYYTVHHDINLNFSIFVKEFVLTMMMVTVPRTVRFETVAPNSVTFSFEG